MSTKNKMSAHIVTEQKPVIKDERAHGWGENATNTVVEGEVMAITIALGNESQFMIRLHENGHLRITNYKGVYVTGGLRNVELETNRPWKRPKRKSKS